MIPVNNALTLENGINEPILKNILSLNFLYNIEMSSKEQLQSLMKVKKNKNIWKLSPHVLVWRKKWIEMNSIAYFKMKTIVWNI
ncbi:hypothetical protein SAP269_05210 [Spiroplasma ixodetis]|uniref:Uncharacterized protein n=1 Tax=Spiroplasma ixodetis TaxID=2141 RepID=A0ABN7BSK7_9MOLU